MNKIITLKERPSGKPEEKNFEFKEEEKPKIDKGEILPLGDIGQSGLAPYPRGLGSSPTGRVANHHLRPQIATHRGYQSNHLRMSRDRPIRTCERFAIASSNWPNLS